MPKNPCSSKNSIMPKGFLKDSLAQSKTTGDLSQAKGSSGEALSENSTLKPRRRNPKGVAAKAWRPDSLSSGIILPFFRIPSPRFLGPAREPGVDPGRSLSFKESTSMASVPFGGRLEEVSRPRPFELPLSAHHARWAPTSLMLFLPFPLNIRAPAFDK